MIIQGLHSGGMQNKSISLRTVESDVSSTRSMKQLWIDETDVFLILAIDDARPEALCAHHGWEFSWWSLHVMFRGLESLLVFQCSCRCFWLTSNIRDLTIALSGRGWTTSYYWCACIYGYCLLPSPSLLPTVAGWQRTMNVAGGSRRHRDSQVFSTSEQRSSGVTGLETCVVQCWCSALYFCASIRAHIWLLVNYNSTGISFYSHVIVYL